MSVAIVVPCFNEADRLDADAFVELAARVDRLLFVDDGSTDATPTVLAAVADRSPDRIRVMRLDANVGKAEAVRAGLLAVMSDGATIAGYLDADLATPPAEMLRLVAALEDHPAVDAVLASRVALLGHAIARHPSRHYLGRLYATAASLALAVPVYDTQCGAKLFRVCPTLEHALTAPFPDRWSFDVELLARLLYPPDGDRPLVLLEVPLRSWRDVRGSKLGLGGAARSLVALVGVRRRVRRSNQFRAGGR